MIAFIGHDVIKIKDKVDALEKRLNGMLNDMDKINEKLDDIKSELKNIGNK